MGEGLDLVEVFCEGREDFRLDGGDTGTDTEVSERLRGHGATRTLATWELVTGRITSCDLFNWLLAFFFDSLLRSSH